MEEIRLAAEKEKEEKGFVNDRKIGVAHGSNQVPRPLPLPVHVPPAPAQAPLDRGPPEQVPLHPAPPEPVPPLVPHIPLPAIPPPPPQIPPLGQGLDNFLNFEAGNPGEVPAMADVNPPAPGQAVYAPVQVQFQHQAPHGNGILGRPPWEILPPIPPADINGVAQANFQAHPYGHPPGRYFAPPNPYFYGPPAPPHGPPFGPPNGPPYPHPPGRPYRYRYRHYGDHYY